jgi:hypothetical protein
MHALTVSRSSAACGLTSANAEDRSMPPLRTLRTARSSPPSSQEIMPYLRPIDCRIEQLLIRRLIRSSYLRSTFSSGSQRD